MQLAPYFEEGTATELAGLLAGGADRRRLFVIFARSILNRRVICTQAIGFPEDHVGPEPLRRMLAGGLGTVGASVGYDSHATRLSGIERDFAALARSG